MIKDRQGDGAVSYVIGSLFSYIDDGRINVNIKNEDWEKAQLIQRLRASVNKYLSKGRK